MTTPNIIINGLVIDQNKLPMPNIRVEAWDKDLLVDDFVGEAITDSQGCFQISFTASHYKELFLDNNPDLYFKLYLGEKLLHSTEKSVLWSWRRSEETVMITVNTKDFDAPEEPNSKSANASIHIRGQIVNGSGVPLPDYGVDAFEKTIDHELCVGKTTTDAQGNYNMSFVPQSTSTVDLQVQAYNTDDRTNFVSSKIHFNVQGKAEINVIVPVAQVQVAPEFQTVNRKIQAHLGNLRLDQITEDEETGHITYLSNKTGLDARIVAMNIAAHQIGSDLEIDPAHAYALFRSGVPGKMEAIQSLSSESLKETIEKAANLNIIPRDSHADDTLKRLSAERVDFVLNNKPLAAVSSMGDMLSLRLNDEQKQVFAQVYSEFGNDASKLWSGLSQIGFSESIVSQLQLDGKLGYLTGQNAELVKKIYQAYPLKSETDLVSHQLHKADAWKAVIKDDVPEDLTVDEYATYLANQVKMGYPNLVAASMIQNEEVDLGKNVPIEELSAFFNSNDSSSNKIGIKPVKKWESYTKLSTPAKAAAKTFERLYQLSPSDESMIAMSKSGLHSAYQIAHYTQSEFMSLHGKSFPNPTEALKVFTKANEVYSASLSIATGYITQRSSPNVYVLSGQLDKTQYAIDASLPSEDILEFADAQNMTIAYPTLEDLFKNMDYCSCDHCKSVLSPAAYLVELLQFIDLTGIPHSGANPIDALNERRPDIENIQLSCENTNMALPYIDLVNEILEYYILHDDLENLSGHDVTEENTQAELLAEPKFVQEQVYNVELKEEVFPYNLPFHQPLETLRRIFNLWGLTLGDCLRVFSSPLSAQKEKLGLSEDEYKTLTDTQHKKLPLYFGEPENNSIVQLNSAISNAKVFSRRVGITNEHLVQLLKTNFINPGHILTSKLQKLTISISNLQRFYEGTLSPADLDAMIPTTIDVADYGGDVIQWLNLNQALIMGLITLTDVSEAASECNFAEVELRYALPDTAQNSLTPVAYHKFHRFLRLLKKTGWSIETLDAVIKPLLPIAPLSITESNIDDTFITLLSRMANFLELADLLGYSPKKYGNLLLLLDPSQTVLLRQEQLARILKINLSEMLDLAMLSGLDPLAADLEGDEPSLIKFVKTIKKLKANGLKTADLSYLLRHEDTTGKLTPSLEIQLKHVKLLKDALNKVELENSVAPTNADFALAKSKMLLMYDTATTDRFFVLLLGTGKYISPLITTQQDLPLLLSGADSNLSFDTFKKELSYTGMLTAARKTAIETVLTALVPADFTQAPSAPELAAYKASFTTALNALATASANDLTDFSTAFPELRVIYDAVIVETEPSVQTQRIVSMILPDLKETLKTNAIHQVLISILKVEAELVKTLTSSADVLKSADPAEATKSLIYDFEQLEEKLVFDQNNTYDFYLDVPATDDYILYLSAPQNTRVTLSTNGTALINNVTIGVSGEISNALPLTLKTGSLHLLRMEVNSLPATNEVSLSWRTRGMAKAPIPDGSLYAKAKVDFAKNSLIRIEKATQISKLFNLNYLELEYFAALNTETRDFLNEIPAASGISTVTLNDLWMKIDLLSYFQNIKKANEPEENTWLSVLLNPSMRNIQNNFLLESFNGWQEADLSNVLLAFGFVRADLSRLSHLQKVMDGMQRVNAIGYPAVQSLTWMTNDPTYNLVAGIKTTIKNRLTESVWLESMQSVNDVVRNKLRDALVSYILQYKRPSPEITNPNKLYEYFLIDVEMDACMKTSRIRQAISTVQLFIQRCLINLEPSVDSSSIRAEQWLWMKRYRVWEANRKVFLYPENWLEPELRDNKSSFFRELEGELMQQEITDESAELAFLSYLKKLDDIAKLEMVGMYLEENEQGNQDDDILHVIGRTNGNTRQHYYRRYEYGTWTPWEKIGLTIEGDHVFPVIWKKRLFVFWLNILEKPAPILDTTMNSQDLSFEPIGDSAKTNVEINMAWGEYYKGKWTSPKSTELNKPLMISYLSQFNKNELLLHGRKDFVENPTGKFRERLIFDVQYGEPFNRSIRVNGRTTGIAPTIHGGTFTFTSKNAPPQVEQYAHDQQLQSKVVSHNTTAFKKAETQAYLDNNRIDNSGRVFSVNVLQPKKALQLELKKTMFTKGDKLTSGFNLLPLRHPIENQFEAPLSYCDERSTLFARPSETLVTVDDFKHYYPLNERPIEVIEPPLLIEKPIGKWPPIDPFENNFEEIVTNPWSENVLGVNENITIRLADDISFEYGMATFSNQGAVILNNEQQF